MKFLKKCIKGTHYGILLGILQILKNFDATSCPIIVDSFKQLQKIYTGKKMK